MRRQIASLLLALVAVLGGVANTAAEETLGLYRAHFDAVYTDNRHVLDEMAASGDGYTYYHFSYALDGTLGMFEGTRDEKYLEQALVWAERMVSRATILDINGRRNWAGDLRSRYSSTPISHHLHDLQGSVQLARLVRIILTDTVLKSTYGARAGAIHRFVKDDIVDKWLYTRDAESWYRRNAIDGTVYSDKTAMFVSIVANLARIERNIGYVPLAWDLLAAFRARMRPYAGGALIWDAASAPDTSHANRMPYMVVNAYEAGILVSRAEVDGLAKLLTHVIWNQSLTSPRFRNFIDGGNAEVFNRPPYGVGQIYSGWIALGAYSQPVQAIGDAVFTALMNGVKNPSLAYMGTANGKLCLIGHLAKNHRSLRVSDVLTAP